MFVKSRNSWKIQLLSEALGLLSSARLVEVLMYQVPRLTGQRSSGMEEPVGVICGLVTSKERRGGAGSFLAKYMVP